jgi:hypothetical protein
MEQILPLRDESRLDVRHPPESSNFFLTNNGAGES